jgi:hypothetical protein
MVYVPYYDSRVVYGSWWWPDYQPVYWSPFPGYAYYGGLAFGFGRGISLRRDFFYGRFDWGRRHVGYGSHRPYYYRGGDFGRGWRNDRHDGRRNVGNRWNGSQPRWNGTQPRGNGTQPRWNGTQPRGNGAQPRERPQYFDGARPGQRVERERDLQRVSPAVRNVAPRFNADGVRPGGNRVRPERVAPLQAVAPGQAVASGQAVAPGQAIAPQQGFVRPQRPQQSVQRAAPQAEKPGQRSDHEGRGNGGGHRGEGGGNRGEGGGRGRER